VIHWIGDHLHFLRETVGRFETTGAIAPSSRFAAEALTRPLRERTDPVRVLEVGPGTGAVTDAIVPHIKPTDRLDLVEINERFAELLRKRFTTVEAYQRIADRAEIHNCPLQEFKADQPYDVIISGLPFNNFQPELVAELVDRSLSLLAPGGTFSFFEYMYVRPLRRMTSRRQERVRLSGVERVLQERFSGHRFRTDWVFVNLPPAWVQHLRATTEPVSARKSA